MSTIKSSDEHLTLNADGSSKDIKFQANGVEKASISSAGAFTSTTIDATKLTGTIPNFTSTGIDDNADATAITIDSSENVGIGTTPETGWRSSAVGVDIGTGGAIAGYDGGSGAMQVLSNAYWHTSGGSGWKYKNSSYPATMLNSDGEFVFKTAGNGTADNAISWTTAMTIKNNGQIQMAGYDGGTGACLGINAQDSLAAAIYLRLISAADSNQTMIQFSDSAEQDCGTITTNASANTTAYNTSSDYRLKENVAPMTNQIARLKNLKPSTWDWKKEENYTGGEGFLAHELNTVVPLAVTGEKDAMRPEVLYVEGDEIPEGKSVGDVKRAEIPKYQGVDYSKLVPLLTGALQEAVDKIEALEARIAALEA